MDDLEHLDMYGYGAPSDISATTVHEVQSGESLASVASLYNVNQEQLQQANVLHHDFGLGMPKLLVIPPPTG